jgi:hypothetical protein
VWGSSSDNGFKLVICLFRRIVQNNSTLPGTWCIVINIMNHGICSDICDEECIVETLIEILLEVQQNYVESLCCIYNVSCKVQVGHLIVTNQIISWYAKILCVSCISRFLASGPAETLEINCKFILTELVLVAYRGVRMWTCIVFSIKPLVSTSLFQHKTSTFLVCIGKSL